MADALDPRDGRWITALAQFNIGIGADAAAFTKTLDGLTQVLAWDDATRLRLGSNSSLWEGLRKLWSQLSAAQSTGDLEDGLVLICGTLAKFTRNLVAGVSENQFKAYENEPDIRQLLHYHTSWVALENNESSKVARLLAQTLSNIVTTNEELKSKLWDTYMHLPEDQKSRLLHSPDPATLWTVLTFILNCIYDSRERSTMLSQTTVGCRICIILLDVMLKLFDAEELTQGGRAFDVGYEIFTQLINHGLVPDLYAKFTIADEIVTPHQTTLLKIIDSYLQGAGQKAIHVQQNLNPMLARRFLDLSRYAQQAIQQAIDSMPTGPAPGTRKSCVPEGIQRTPATSSTATKEPQQEEKLHVPLSSPTKLDFMLPKVCEALVLVTQCIVTVTLETERTGPRHDLAPGSEQDLKAFFIETRSEDDNVGLVDSLIGLLHRLDLFLPRINFGKPVGQLGSSALTLASRNNADVNGFQYLKRDLVRLLGILCYGRKAVQDHVREQGGIEIVMNLCVIDERNPYLREHAIFTLHNLLKENPENQAVVQLLRPMEEWDEVGIVS